MMTNFLLWSDQHVAQRPAVVFQSERRRSGQADNGETEAIEKK
jgi:hypothetical protein